MVRTYSGRGESSSFSYVDLSIDHGAGLASDEGDSMRSSGPEKISILC